MAENYTEKLKARDKFALGIGAITLLIPTLLALWGVWEAGDYLTDIETIQPPIVPEEDWDELLAGASRLFIPVLVASLMAKPAFKIANFIGGTIDK